MKGPFRHLGCGIPAGHAHDTPRNKVIGKISAHEIRSNKTIRLLWRPKVPRGKEYGNANVIGYRGIIIFSVPRGKGRLDRRTTGALAGYDLLAMGDAPCLSTMPVGDTFRSIQHVLRIETHLREMRFAYTQYNGVSVEV